MRLLAATLAAYGTWNITGTSGNDEIYVARDEVDSTVLQVEVNGRVVDQQYASDVKLIQISGGGGNDHLVVVYAERFATLVVDQAQVVPMSATPSFSNLMPTAMAMSHARK